MSERKWFVGQEVLMFDSSRRNDQGSPAVVSKVGRTLVYIQRYGRDAAYRQDTGYSNGDYRGRIESADDTALRLMNEAASERLRELGIHFDHRSRRLTTEQKVELADLVTSWDETTQPTVRAMREGGL